ncbi:MAG TPA: VWA domain-containing protein [Acidobacteriaceae bacterium]|jgi:VWFA-related protein|nr:VWA domain-containing protein [Acidobacteriaceae bacterium]
MRTLLTLALFALTSPLLHAPLLQAQQGQPQPAATNSNPNTPGYVLKVQSDLVLTNVVVRDKHTGAVVKGLTAKDFTILENGKPQKIDTFDFQSIDQAEPLNEATVSGKAGQLVLGKGNSTGVVTGDELRNHRLVVLFFDLTSMQPDDLTRSVEAAKNYINRQMQAADLVAAVSLDASINVDQDFTANKQALLAAVSRYDSTQQAGFQPGAVSTTNQVEDASSFTPDESEYNDINTDRQLYAIAQISKSLQYINQKKSLLYFSGGIQRDGIENEASLRSATNSAVRANMSIYSVDMRGLQAISPLGDASTGSIRGASAYNGQAFQNNLDANFNSQEVLSTLAADTGGKFYGDSNDFAPAFQAMENDTAQYYVIGFRSTNPARDGRYRRLQIKLNRADVKLEYRPGYYAPADYQHSNHEDRERQLTEQLESDLPATDVPVYMAAYYFELAPDRYYIPVSLIVPGSQIPFVKGGDRDKATIDIIGEVKDMAGRAEGEVRQTVKLAIDQQQQVSRKNVQYTTSFTLPPGKYHVKFVIRENETGHMGSFETDITVPDLAKAPMKLSSVLLASQRQPAPKSKQANPLIQDGQLWVPNVAHVFRQDGHLYLLYEVYAPDMKSADAKTQSPRLLTSIEFLSGSTKVFETPLVEATKLTDPSRNTIAFQFDVPLKDMKPGQYTCQVNVIDDRAGAFSFPRTGVLVR